MFLRLAALALVATTVLSEVYFKEEFLDEGWKDRWVVSKHKDDYGEWKWSHGKFYGDSNRDKGIQTGQDARFYSISSKFPKAFSNKGKPLVIQFTVKHEQGIDCGGGYAKIMAGDINQEDFHGETPYNIMFGPDICGPGTKKVHVIFTYKGKNHLIKKDIRCKVRNFLRLLKISSKF